MSADKLFRNIEPSDIVEIANSDKGRKCRRLAVLGPGESSIGANDKSWPDFLKDCDLVISLKTPLRGHIKKLGVFDRLEALCLRGNRLNHEDAAKLRQLMTLEKLKELDLNNNDFGDEGAKEIAGLKNLERLDLGRNDIGNSGSKSFGSLRELERLSIAHNKISDDDIKWIGNLSACEKLDTLNVSLNKIGDKSSKEFLQLKSLKFINLSDNKISISSKKHLKELIKNTLVNIDRNDIDPDTKQSLYDERVSNRLTGEHSYIGKKNYQEVIEAELEHILNPDEYVGGQRDRLIGLALSGGGVRSASFSLGVLQALADKDHLQHVHYMSTVSGGGYIGSSLSWFIGKYPSDEYDPTTPGFDTSKTRFPIGSKERSFLDVYEANEENRNQNGECPPQVQILDHIRQRGSYLTPKGGWDVFKLLAMVSRAMIPSFSIYFCLLLLPLALIAYLLAVPPITDQNPFCRDAVSESGKPVICPQSAEDDDLDNLSKRPPVGLVQAEIPSEPTSAKTTGGHLRTVVSDLLAHHGALRLAIGVFCVLAATALIAAFSSGLSEARRDTSEQAKTLLFEFRRWSWYFGTRLLVSTFLIFLAVLYLLTWGDLVMPIVLFAMLTGILSKRLITFPFLLFLLFVPIIIFHDRSELTAIYYNVSMLLCFVLILIAFPFCKSINGRRTHLLNTILIFFCGSIAILFAGLPESLVDRGWIDVTPVQKEHQSPMHEKLLPSLVLSTVLAFITFLAAALLWLLDFKDERYQAENEKKRRKNDEDDQESGDGSVLRESYDERKELSKPGAGLLVAFIVLLTLACLTPIYLWFFGELLGPSLTLAGITAYFGKLFIEVRNIRSKYANLEGLLIGIASVGSVIGLLLMALTICDLLYGDRLLSVNGNVRESWWAHWPPIVTVALIFIVAYCLARSVNVNFVGLHRFYRDRLMETFMPEVQVNDSKSDVEPGEGDEKTSADEFFVHNLRDVTSGRQRRAPYHIINTNVVLINSRDARFRGRGGANFIISPLYSGSDATGWRSTESWRVRAGHMTLATAMAVSGAAINPRTGPSGRGPMRKAFASFLMTLFNARLGLWVLNPKVMQGRSWIDSSDKKNWSVPGDDDSFLPEPKASPNFIKPGLWQGLLGCGYHENKQFIELTDGAHFDNTGLYELIRRHVKLIILVDVSEDKDFNYAGLASAFERVRADFGVQIRFGESDRELKKLLHDPDGPDAFWKKLKLAERGYAMARIDYQPQNEEHPDEDDGMLVIIKATMVEDLPADVLGYKSAHEDFPNESTTDQFFDEIQLEAYRELGYRLGRTALDDDVIDDEFRFCATGQRPSVGWKLRPSKSGP